MVVVKFLPRAEKDLLKLPPLIQDDILRRVEFLSDFPLMGQKMDRAYSGYRYLLAGKNKYRIIYKVMSSQRVFIAYIRHCRRQLGLRVVH